jgi:hypothetical protein
LGLFHGKKAFEFPILFLLVGLVDRDIALWVSNEGYQSLTSANAPGFLMTAYYTDVEYSDLFCFDRSVLQSEVLISDDVSTSKVEYDEYVVYRVSDNGPAEAGQKPCKLGHRHVTHKFNQDETPGAKMLDTAFRAGFGVDVNVNIRFATSS